MAELTTAQAQHIKELFHKNLFERNFMSARVTPDASLCVGHASHYEAPIHSMVDMELFMAKIIMERRSILPYLPMLQDISDPFIIQRMGQCHTLARKLSDAIDLVLIPWTPSAISFIIRFLDSVPFEMPAIRAGSLASALKNIHDMAKTDKYRHPEIMVSANNLARKWTHILQKQSMPADKIKNNESLLKSPETEIPSDEMERLTIETKKNHMSFSLKIPTVNKKCPLKPTKKTDKDIKDTHKVRRKSLSPKHEPYLCSKSHTHQTPISTHKSTSSHPHKSTSSHKSTTKWPILPWYRPLRIDNDMQMADPSLWRNMMHRSKSQL